MAAAAGEVVRRGLRVESRWPQHPHAQVRDQGELPALSFEKAEATAGSPLCARQRECPHRTWACLNFGV